MTDAFLITGSRPPSARSRSRQSVVRPKSGYKKVSDSSEVDELLFQSNNNFSAGSTRTMHDYHSTGSITWANKVPVEKRDRPLLWAPTSTLRSEKSSGENGLVLHPSHTNLMKPKYRVHKHTPSFVDETLFGPKLEKPSFEAPWAEKKEKTRPYLFSSMDYTKCSTPASSSKGATLGSDLYTFGVDGRPPSRMGPRPASTRNRPCTVESVSSSKTVWKP